VGDVSSPWKSGGYPPPHIPTAVHLCMQLHIHKSQQVWSLNACWRRSLATVNYLSTGAAAIKRRMASITVICSEWVGECYCLLTPRVTAACRHLLDCTSSPLVVESVVVSHPSLLYPHQHLGATRVQIFQFGELTPTDLAFLALLLAFCSKTATQSVIPSSIYFRSTQPGHPSTCR